MKGMIGKRLKKCFVFVLTAALALPLAISGFGGSIRQVQAETSVKRYFYEQLTEKEKPFYDAMEYMYVSGMFKTGTENLDLTEGDTVYVSQDDLASYANGSPDLLDWMGAARDAFYFDHPDIFYVDFSALSLRVTIDAQDTYHAYLGTGRRTDYFNEAYTSQAEVEEDIKAYEKAINEIVEEVKNLQVDQHMDLTREQITWVHNYVTTHTSYILEDGFVGREDNSGAYLIRTAYGSLVRGESACEGYARAVKAILDRLDIPCVLVQGYFRHTQDQLEPHMWNYVQLDGKWYGLDATMDDPVSSRTETDNTESGNGTTDYLLKGADTMDVRHVPVGIVSGAGFEFHYPTLTFASLDYQVLQNSDGLVVEYKTDMFEGEVAGFFQVSYEGMGYAKAAENGKYILTRFYQYVPGKDKNDPDEYVHNEWAYVEPELYPAIEDTDDYVLFPVPHCIYAEFAVTSIPPNLPENLKDFNPNVHSFYFEGDPLLFDAQSDLIYNYEGDYVAPPYPEDITPSLSVRMIREGSYDITVVYNDKLIPVDGETPGYKLSNPTGPTALQYSKIENFQWDGDRTISFHFTPSQMFADESTYYYFQFTGLVGETSKKPPIEISYAVATGICPRGCILCGDYNWKVFGRPTLLGDGDLSMSGWKTSDGEDVSELLKNRIALVVSSPSEKEEDSMQDLIGSKNDGHEVLASSTYDITLTACKNVIVNTGDSIQISLGFPEGFGPEDEGVTFKAYHFIRNKAGEVTGIEEIPCVVTRFGLIITCKSFSPFAVVAVEGETETTRKAAVIPSFFGGSISVNEEANSSVYYLDEGDKINVVVTADEGYCVERITVDGRPISDISAGQKSCSFTLSYEDLQDVANSIIIDTQFVATAVQEFEAENGQTVIQPTPEEIIVPEVKRTPRTSTGTTPATQPSASQTPTPESPASQAPAPQAPASQPSGQQNSNNGWQPAPESPATTAPATPAPATAAPSSGTPAQSRPAASTPAATAAPSFTPATVGSVAESEPEPSAETSDGSLGTVAFADTVIGGIDDGPGLFDPSDYSDESNLYWLIIPILILAAAAGAGIYYITNKRPPRDNW